ncbi:MAG: hypothetical protein JWM80_3151 [Cyanobacteria bacterium RYN_339]|nr:hypothetical protein [Cyanobacteria bacterium RYN_339]
MDEQFSPESFDEPALELRVSSTMMPYEPLPEPESTEVQAPLGKIADDDAVAGMLAPFFHKGYVNRKDAKGLMNPVHREEAERRLNAVGLTLAWSPYSRYYGLALADGPGGNGATGQQKERITNMTELDRNALALLVILWARLVLPQRLAEEGREGGVAEPTVSFEALNAEYGKKLGGRRFEMYVGQLKRLGFLEYTRKDEIKAGPFLDLLGDSNQLASYLRQSTLAKVMREQPEADEIAEEVGA